MRDRVFVLECSRALSAFEVALVKRVQHKPVDFDFFVFSTAVGTVWFFLLLVEFLDTRKTIEVFAFGALLWLLYHEVAN